MRRIRIGLGLALLVGLALLAGCQRNVPLRSTALPTGQMMAQASQTSQPPAASATSAAAASTPTAPGGTRLLSAQPATETATPSATPPATSTPTITPTPTATPVPSQRLAAAQQAFAWGDYARARQEFAALEDDPGANAAERQFAAYWLGRSALEAGDYPPALDLLNDFLEAYPDDPQAPSVHLLRARAYEGLREWRQAIDAYQAYLDTSDGALAMYAYQDMGDAAMLALEYARAAQAYTAGLDVAPDNGWVVTLREGIAQSQLARDNPAGALEQYDLILSIARIPAYRARILYQAGQALAAAGDEAAAYERYAQAVNRYPEAYNSYLALVELVDAGQTVDDYQRGLVDYYAEAYQPAIDAFDRYLQANPQARGGDALWYLALSYKANGNLLQAIEAFEQLIDDHPQNQHARQAWLEMAETFAWRDQIERAIETYRDFAGRQPSSPLAATALWEAAQLEVDADRWEAAAASFRDLAARYPDDDGAPDALFQAALLDYRRDEFESARDGWQALVADYPDSEEGPAARFWLGKAWLALGDTEQARAAFEDARESAGASYYGVRAAELLGQGAAAGAPAAPLTQVAAQDEQAQAEAWLAGWLPITRTQTLAALSPAMASQPALRRGDALLAAGRRTDALEEYDVVRNAGWEDPLAVYQLALAFRDRGLYRLSIMCAERLIWLSPVASREEAPVFIQRLSYPIYYEELIAAEAQAMGYDPMLLYALIRQESLFEPSITSPADARGLMQVIPDTGDWIAGQLGQPGFDADDLWRPVVNVNFGAWYLSVQLDTFAGEIIPALAAYNAGPGRIHRWQEDAPDVDLLVETMPFAEPRRYIRYTYENYAHYRRLYPN